MKKVYFGLLFTLITTVGQAQVIAAGWGHSLTVCSDSMMQSFGRNAPGALGNANFINSNVPVTVSTLNTVIVTAAGFDHSMALLADSTVWCWGNGGAGRLGNGSNANSNIPVQVTGLTGVIDIAAGAYHSMALKADGTVWCWGENGNDQLGNGTGTDSNIPVQVSSLTGAIDIAGGSSHSLAAKADGTVWGWGVNGSGTLGTGDNLPSSTPIQAIGLSGITQVFCGQTHSAALKNDSTVWCFGSGSSGQNGNGSNSNVYTPTQVSGVTGVVAIAYGSMALHTAVLKADGTMWVWGGNDYGQLGNGVTGNTNTPAIVPGISGITQISAGNVHSMALKDDGTTWTWGWNAYGQLGDGTNVDIYSANSISGICSLLIPTCNSTSLDVQNACGSYTWMDGITYSASNSIATYVLPNAAGCDSTITLNLTILNTSSSTDVLVACDNYTWIDGNTYNASNNTATYLLTNAVGCDSLVTLDLTLNSSTSSTDVQTSCGDYTWIDGNTYTSSNNSAIYLMTNSTGCDSLITLDLTLITIDNTTTQTGLVINANMVGATYQWLDCDNGNAVLPGETNQSFTASLNGSYAVEVTNNGCVDTSSCVVVANIGIGELSGIEISVYPNPSTGEYYLSKPSHSQNIEYHILDIHGSVILSGILTEDKESINLTRFSSGMYFLRTDLGSMKLVKE